MEQVCPNYAWLGHEAAATSLMTSSKMTSLDSDNFHTTRRMQRLVAPTDSCTTLLLSRCEDLVPLTLAVTIQRCLHAVLLLYAPKNKGHRDKGIT